MEPKSRNVYIICINSHVLNYEVQSQDSPVSEWCYSRKYLLVWHSWSGRGFLPQYVNSVSGISWSSWDFSIHKTWKTFPFFFSKCQLYQTFILLLNACPEKYKWKPQQWPKMRSIIFREMLYNILHSIVMTKYTKVTTDISNQQFCFQWNLNNIN